MVCHIFVLKIRTAKVKGFAVNAKANTKEFLARRLNRSFLNGSRAFFSNFSTSELPKFFNLTGNTWAMG
jgi:hypothetical protein